jgi:hypothetical protein
MTDYVVIARSFLALAVTLRAKITRGKTWPPSHEMWRQSLKLQIKLTRTWTVWILHWLVCQYFGEMAPLV